VACLLACLGASAVAVGGASGPTAATWTDEVHAETVVTAGQACTGLSVRASPLRAADSAWDEVGTITLMGVPEECAGLAVVVSVHDSSGDEPIDLLSSDAATAGRMDLPLHAPVLRGAYDRSTVTFASWPVTITRNSPVVAVGSGAVWTSHDGGTMWDLETALDGTANAVATDGAGNWVAVGYDTSSRARIWRATADALGTWQVVNLSTGDVVPSISDLVLTDVATDGRGTWVAVGGTASSSHRSAVWTSTDNGVTWNALPSASIEGTSRMEAIATDGTNWVAGGWAQNGTGSVWHTSTPTVAASWECETGNVADSTTCSRGGPSAPVLGLATDGLEHWLAVGYGAPGATSVPCKGAWRSTSANLTAWTGSQLKGGAAANCTKTSEQGWDVAADVDGGVWLATGSGGTSRGVWRSYDFGQTWTTGSSVTVSGRSVATDQEGLWLLATQVTTYRTTSVASTTSWKTPTKVPTGASVAAPMNDLAFDQSLPMGPAAG
jgi:hypothetical protein